MQKFLVAALSVLAFALFGAASAQAKGNPCPPASHNPGHTPPNCGHGNGPSGNPGTCHNHKDDDGDGKTDGDDSECQDPNDGVEDGSDDQGGGNTCDDGQDNDGDGATDGDDTECQDPNDGDEDGSDGGGGGDTCPPATGPISSIVQQVSDGIRDGGGAPLADVIDQINCGLIVGVLGL